MKQSLTNFAVAVFIFTLVGCIDPVNFETDPVKVSTGKGDVICQLYRLDDITWDRAISVPAGMSIKTGDALCKQRGELLINQTEQK